MELMCSEFPGSKTSDSVGRYSTLVFLLPGFSSPIFRVCQCFPGVGEMWWAESATAFHSWFQTHVWPLSEVRGHRPAPVCISAGWCYALGGLISASAKMILVTASKVSIGSRDGRGRRGGEHWCYLDAMGGVKVVAEWKRYITCTQCANYFGRTQAVMWHWHWAIQGPALIIHTLISSIYHMTSCFPVLKPCRKAHDSLLSGMHSEDIHE